MCVCVCLTECDLEASKRGGPGPELAASQEQDKNKTKKKRKKQVVQNGGRVSTSNCYCRMIRNVCIGAGRHMHAPAKESEG